MKGNLRKFTSTMTTTQAALVIREAIREAAKHVGCLPSEAHDPSVANRQAIHARNRALVAAYRQGVPRHTLAAGFKRCIETVNAVILQDARKPVA